VKNTEEKASIIAESSKKIVPRIVQIEPIFGCNASCVMCVIDMPTKRKKGIMSMDLFMKIVGDLLPYKDKIGQIDLFGLGEPLMDKHIFDRIRYLKGKVMRGVGISTNADLLDDKKQDILLDSGIDTVIFSIESTKKEIHERIRRNTDFDRVVRNANKIIEKRNQRNLKTKFVFRFINQKINEGGWEEYKNYWACRIDKNKGDQINLYTAHDWVGEIKNHMIESRKADVEAMKCYQIFERMFIFCDGTMSMCSCDLHHPYMPVGNVTKANSIDVYNGNKMREIREIHLSGNKNTIEICNNCNMLYCKDKKKVVTDINSDVNVNAS
jgi:wyosine [tRNA(Phe)-imidazoG37] synthetase (radical SAM superfamily)